MANEKLNEYMFNVLKDENLSSSVKIKKLKYLFYLGGEVDYQEKSFGWSLLSKACDLGDEEVVSFLLEKKPNLELRNYASETALMVAVRRGYVGIVDKLALNNCDINKKFDSSQPLIKEAMSMGHVEMVSKLIDIGCDVNEVEASGWTFLKLAIHWENKEIFDVLLEKGADVNESGMYRDTPLNDAVSTLKFDFVKKLVEKGADVNKKGSLGRNPLMFAIIRKNEEMVQYLLDNGANWRLKDDYGADAIGYLKEYSCENFMKMFEEREKSLNMKSMGKDR